MPNKIPITPKHNFLAILGAFLIYALWYRIQIGPWCPAMWHGTAPVFIIVVAFSSLRKIISRIS